MHKINFMVKKKENHGNRLFVNVVKLKQVNTNNFYQTTNDIISTNEKVMWLKL